MPKHTLQLEIELDPAAPEDEQTRLAAIQGWLSEHMTDDWGPDNPTSDEMPMRFDGLEPPFVRLVESKLIGRTPDPEPVATEEPARLFTVIGHWADDDTRSVTAVVPGEVDVSGGGDISDGGPFAVVVEAEDADAAEKMVEGSGTDQDFD